MTIAKTSARTGLSSIVSAMGGNAVNVNTEFPGGTVPSTQQPTLEEEGQLCDPSLYHSSWTNQELDDVTDA